MELCIQGIGMQIMERKHRRVLTSAGCAEVQNYMERRNASCTRSNGLRGVKLNKRRLNSLERWRGSFFDLTPKEKGINSRERVMPILGF